MERGGTLTGDGDPCAEVFEQLRGVRGGEVGTQHPCPVRASHQIVEGGTQPAGGGRDVVRGRQPAADQREERTACPWADSASRRKRAKADQGPGSSVRAVRAWVTSCSILAVRIR